MALDGLPGKLKQASRNTRLSASWKANAQDGEASLQELAERYPDFQGIEIDGVFYPNPKLSSMNGKASQKL